jgi:hypothetical protein
MLASAMKTASRLSIVMALLFFGTVAFSVSEYSSEGITGYSVINGRERFEWWRGVNVWQTGTYLWMSILFFGVGLHINRRSSRVFPSADA